MLVNQGKRTRNKFNKIWTMKKTSGLPFENEDESVFSHNEGQYHQNAFQKNKLESISSIQQDETNTRKSEVHNFDNEYINEPQWAW